ncbi:hypothetical protein [Arthrobacter flavus]|uniref:MinD-like ATPase involved in chromosome partitioning or flagellar assembly n=1 Tax=Arthrobacter flavus TaxID=95172 RepID=A0ABW4Q8N7_9MICC
MTVSPTRQPSRRSAPVPAASGAGGSETSTGFESSPQRLRRVLRTRPAETRVQLTLSRIGQLFRADEYPRILAEAASGAQSPVTTGRRIAVVGSRGGAGKTTVAALLARTYASLRADTVTAVDNSVGAGTLGLRLGFTGAPSLADLAHSLNGQTPSSLADLAARLGAAESNLLVAGGAATASPPGAGADDDAARAARAVSRFCPITILDCGTGMELPSTSWAIQQSHAAIFVTPATVAGLEDARRYAEQWNGAGSDAAIPLLTLVLQTDARNPVDAVEEAERLSHHGTVAVALPYDRHLAGGVELDLGLLSRASLLTSTTVASRILLAATGKAKP